MARYRKVEPAVWLDDKFQSLSSPSPNAQTLWIYLLTCPFTTSIPGLYIAGKAAIAEALRWEDDMEGFEKAFQEILDRKMCEYDKKTRLVWIPKAIAHNLPESPNVVLSWKNHYAEMTDCSLLKNAVNVIRESVYGCDVKAKAFREAFDKVFGEDLPKDLSKGSPKTYRKTKPNQEQEQEQKGPMAFSDTDADLQETTRGAFSIVDNSVDNFDQPFGSVPSTPSEQTPFDPHETGKGFVETARAIEKAKSNPIPDGHTVWVEGDVADDEWSKHLEQSG